MVLSDDQPITQSRLQVETDLNALPIILQWFEQCNLSQLSQQQWYQCQLALTEAFTNAVLHAHHNLPPTTPIVLEMIVFADYLEMRIWDLGAPFNLEAKLQSILQEPPDIWKEEGRGLIFMKQLSDEIFYLRVPEQQNCLVIRKIIRK